MKKVLSFVACLMFVLVGGVALTACGGKSTISKEQFIEYVSQESVKTEFSGYEFNAVVEGADINAIVLSDGENLNAKITISETLKTQYVEPVYIENNIVYFSVDGVKYYTKLETFNESFDNIDNILMYRGDLTDICMTIVDSYGEDGLKIIKKVKGNEVTFNMNASIKFGDIKTENIIDIKYTNNILSSMHLKATTGDTLISEILLNSYTGTIDFPDFSNYVEYSTIEGVSLKNVYDQINTLDCNWKNYEVYDAVCQDVKYDAKVALVDEKLQVEIVAENGYKIYLKDNVVYFDNGKEKLKTNFQGFSFFNIEDSNFGEAYNFISSAVVVEDHLDSIFNSSFIIEDIKYIENKVLTEGYQVRVDKSQDADLTTYVIALSYEGESSSRILMFDETKLLEYSVETVEGTTSFVYSNVAIEFPDLSEYVEVI